jgi:hypothetical protein
MMNIGRQNAIEGHWDAGLTFNRCGPAMEAALVHLVAKLAHANFVPSRHL